MFPPPFKDDDRRLFFLCEAQETVFTEMGKVFLAAAPATQSAGEMIVEYSAQCPNKRCVNGNGSNDPVPDPHSTDCIAYVGICYHRLHPFEAEHICR